MRIGIAGYGNLGRAVEELAKKQTDTEIVGIFTRRDISSVRSGGADVYSLSDIQGFVSDIDVLLLCHGSSQDIPSLAPMLASNFNTVDAFDNHKESKGYKMSMDDVAKCNLHTSVVCLGWDPGFLSLIRLYSSAFIPNVSVNTFWGRGVSQGHSEALRRIDGVRGAVQYTVPREDALTLAGLVCHPLADTDRHRRVCYIAAEKEKENLIVDEILSMDNYFSGYETEIHFVSEEELERYHSSLSHRGRIYALGSSGRYREVKHSLYLDLDIGSNPDMTASIMLAGARAAMRLASEKRYGAYDVFDIPPMHFLSEKVENANNYL